MASRTVLELIWRRNIPPAIAIMFALAIYFKVGKVFLLSRRATSRVRRIAENEENKSTLTVDEARVKLLKSAQSM